MTKEELKKLVDESPLEAAVKSLWLSRLETEELTKDFYDELINTMQEAIDQTFAEVGIKEDENNPELKKAYETMMAEVKAAEAEYNATMSDLNKQTAQVQAEADKDFSQLTADIVKGNLP